MLSIITMMMAEVVGYVLLNESIAEVLKGNHFIIILAVYTLLLVLVQSL